VNILTLGGTKACNTKHNKQADNYSYIHCIKLLI
jgi:hypothetical protein